MLLLKISFPESSVIDIEIVFKFRLKDSSLCCINPLNGELNPICHLLLLLGFHHILHISRIRVKAYQL